MYMDPFTIVGLVLAAAGIGYAIYQSHEANKHAKRAEFLLEMILKALQNNGLADLNHDEKGRIIGMNLTIQAKTAALKIQGHPPKVTLSDSGAEDD